MRFLDRLTVGRPNSASGFLAEDVLQVALQNITSRDAADRWEAAELLSTGRDPRAIAPLVARLTHRKGEVQTLAAFALGKIGAPECIDAVVGALGDEGPLDVERTEAAAKALGHAKGRRPALWAEHATRHTEAPVRQYAVGSYARTVGRPLGCRLSARIQTRLRAFDCKRAWRCGAADLRLATERDQGETPSAHCRPEPRYSHDHDRSLTCNCPDSPDMSVVAHMLGRCFAEILTSCDASQPGGSIVREDER